MSDFQPPRAQIRCLPSGDTSKRNMLSALKFVTCLGTLPSNGCIQTLPMPSVDTEYSKALPSGVHFKELLLKKFERTSNLLMAEPSSKEFTAIAQVFLPVAT